MRSRVSLQVERIVEALATEGAQVPFHIAMAFEVTVQQAGQRESFPTDITLEWIGELIRRRLVLLLIVVAERFGHFKLVLRLGQIEEGILETVTTIDELQRGDHVNRDVCHGRESNGQSWSQEENLATTYSAFAPPREPGGRVEATGDLPLQPPPECPGPSPHFRCRSWKDCNRLCAVSTPQLSLHRPPQWPVSRATTTWTKNGCCLAREAVESVGATTMKRRTTMMICVFHHLHYLFCV